MLEQVHLHCVALVDGAPVPDQDHGTTEVPQQPLAASSDIQAIEGSRFTMELERQSPLAWGGHQGADDRELVSLEPMVEERGLTHRGPRPLNGRGERASTLVEEREVSPQALGLF